MSNIMEYSPKQLEKEIKKQASERDYNFYKSDKKKKKKPKEIEIHGLKRKIRLGSINPFK